MAGAPVDAGAPPLTFVVNTTADAPDLTPGNGVCATAASECSLRAAVQEANAWPGVGGDAIMLSSTTYSLSIAGDDNVAAAGDLDITDTVSITGTGSSIIQVSAGNHRVFDVRAGSVLISGVTVQNGKGDEGLSSPGGGGVYVQPGATLALAGVTVSGNSSVSGFAGGIYVGGTLVITASTVSSNSTGGDGGGIYNGGTATIRDSTLAFNTASGLGGGMNNMGTADVLNSTLKANQALGGLGGAIRNRFASLTVTNSTISGNLVGGGIEDFQANATIMSSTIYGNDNGGIQSLDGFGVTIGNSIVAANVGGNCQGALASTGYNVDDGNTCAFAGPGDKPNTDPQVMTLQNNGGLTETHALSASSPAIDAPTQRTPAAAVTLVRRTTSAACGVRWRATALGCPSVTSVRLSTA